MNFLRQVLAVVERVDDDVAWVHGADGVERTIPNDRELKVADTVMLVMADDGSVVKVLDTRP